MVNSVGAEDKRSKPSYENREIYRRKSIPVSKPQQIKDGRLNIVPSTPTPTILDVTVYIRESSVHRGMREQNTT